MLRSLMTAVTGVKAHQTMLDVTGNNIANVNTTGFKRDFTIFQDLLYQTSQGATGPGDQRGGVNPAQVGLGVKVGAIETIHTQGFYQYTGNKDDMLINGEGFFVYRDGSNQIYSRAGNLTRDGENNLVHSGTGYYLQGYKMVRDPLNPMNYVEDGGISDINIPMGQTLEARATTIVGFQKNLDSEAEAYLPIGYADIKSTKESTETKVRIGGIDYEMEFKTNLTAAGGAGYFEVNIGYPNTTLSGTRSMQFNLAGVTQDGYPQLQFISTVLSNGTSVPANNSATLPDGNTQFKVEYEETTGVLKFVGTSGQTLWGTNLFQNMNYKSFTVTRDGQPYGFLAEFNEAQIGNTGEAVAGSMSGSPMEMTLWWQADTGDTNDPDTIEDESKTMKQIVYNVFINQDGTFDSISYKNGIPSEELPWGGTNWYDYAVSGGDSDADFGIIPSTDGASLQFQAKTAANGNLATVDNINQATQFSTKQDIFDCQGKVYTLEVVFKKITGNRWRWEASLPGQEKMFVTPNSGELIFDDSCLLKQPMDAVPITIDFGMNATSFQTIDLDFSGKSFGNDVLQGVTQFASDTTAKPYYQDGYTMGTLNDYSVGGNGIITGSYTNGQTLAIARVALAQFSNPMGLDKIGDTMFRATVNSGQPNINPAQMDGGGSIVGKTLEMSNVDLTEEFTRLIISQRGFQANTRVVTTSDQILEEVVNLKR